MKRLMALLLLLAVTAGADNQHSNPSQSLGGHLLHVKDTDIDSALEIVDADTGFTPLEANAPIRVLYEAANTDTAYVRIAGIAADSTRWDTVILAPGRQPVTGGTTLMAFESAYMEHETNGIVAVYTTGTSAGNMLRHIAANTIHEPIAHIYAGKRGGFLESVEFIHEAATDTSSWELRIYPDIADHRDFADGYVVRASARLNSNNASKAFPELNIQLPANSWTAVFSNAESGSVRGVTGSAILKYRR